MTARTFSRRTDLRDTVYAADVNELQAAIETLSVVYNAVDFGITTALSGSAMSTAINGALTTINAAGGGTLVFHEGTFAATTGITLKDKVHLRGSGVDATHLDFSGLVTPVSGAAMYGEGTLTSLTSGNALTGAISLNGRTITFTSSVAASVSAGDVLVIYDPTDSSFNAARTTYRAGEFVVVKSVSTNVVTLTNLTYAGYASTVSVYKMNPIVTSISDMTMTFTSGSSGISIMIGNKLSFDNLRLTGSDIANLTLAKCFDVSVDNVTSTDYQAEVGYNYGLSLGNCQRVSINGGYYLTGRHGIATGGGDSAGVVPCREITVANAVVGSTSSTTGLMGADFHGNAEWCTWDGCTILNGIECGGDHITIQSCKIRSGPGAPAFIETEALGHDFHFIDNTFEITDHQATTDRAWIEFTSPSTATRTGGTFRFEGNTIDAGPYGGPSGTGSVRGIYLYAQNGAANSNDVVIRNNTIRADYSPVVTAYAIYPRGKWRSVLVADNKLNGMGIRAELQDTDRLEITGNSVFDSRDRGIQVVHTASDPTLLITVAGNNIWKSEHCGIEIGADSTASYVIVENNTSLSNGQTNTGSSVTMSSIYVNGALEAVVRNNTIGDIQAVATQLRADSMNNIGTLTYHNNKQIGGALANAGYRNAITAYGTQSQLEGSKTFDWASIANGAEATTTVTVTGAALGDDATFAHGVDLAGLKGSAYVSAADTVTVVLRNDTGGAVDLASSTLRAFVRKRV